MPHVQESGQALKRLLMPMRGNQLAAASARMTADQWAVTRRRAPPALQPAPSSAPSQTPRASGSRGPCSLGSCTACSRGRPPRTPSASCRGTTSGGGGGGGAHGMVVGCGEGEVGGRLNACCDLTSRHRGTPASAARVLVPRQPHLREIVLLGVGAAAREALGELWAGLEAAKVLGPVHHLVATADRGVDLDRQPGTHLRARPGCLWGSGVWLCDRARRARGGRGGNQHGLLAGKQAPPPQVRAAGGVHLFDLGAVHLDMGVRADGRLDGGTQVRVVLRHRHRRGGHCGGAGGRARCACHRLVWVRAKAGGEQVGVMDCFLPQLLDISV